MKHTRQTLSLFLLLLVTFSLSAQPSDPSVISDVNLAAGKKVVFYDMDLLYQNTRAFAGTLHGRDFWPVNDADVYTKWNPLNGRPVPYEVKEITQVGKKSYICVQMKDSSLLYLRTGSKYAYRMRSVSVWDEALTKLVMQQSYIRKDFIEVCRANSSATYRKTGSQRLLAQAPSRPNMAQDWAECTWTYEIPASFDAECLYKMDFDGGSLSFTFGELFTYSSFFMGKDEYAQALALYTKKMEEDANRASVMDRIPVKATYIDNFGSEGRYPIFLYSVSGSFYNGFSGKAQMTVEASRLTFDNDEMKTYLDGALESGLSLRVSVARHADSLSTEATDAAIAQKAALRVSACNKIYDFRYKNSLFLDGWAFEPKSKTGADCSVNVYNSFSLTITKMEISFKAYNDSGQCVSTEMMLYKEIMAIKGTASIGNVLFTSISSSSIVSVKPVSIRIYFSDGKSKTFDNLSTHLMKSSDLANILSKDELNAIKQF